MEVKLKWKRSFEVGLFFDMASCCDALCSPGCDSARRIVTKIFLNRDPVASNRSPLYTESNLVGRGAYGAGQVGELGSEDLEAGVCRTERGGEKCSDDEEKSKHV